MVAWKRLTDKGRQEIQRCSVHVTSGTNALSGMSPMQSTPAVLISSSELEGAKKHFFSRINETSNDNI